MIDRTALKDAMKEAIDRQTLTDFYKDWPVNRAEFVASTGTWKCSGAHAAWFSIDRLAVTLSFDLTAPISNWAGPRQREITLRISDGFDIEGQQYAADMNDAVIAFLNSDLIREVKQVPKPGGADGQSRSQ